MERVLLFAFALAATFILAPLASAAPAFSSRDAMYSALPRAIMLAQFYTPFYVPPPPKYKKRKYKKKKRRRRRVTTPKCAHPMTYSRGLRKCICVLEGYSLSGGKCMKLAEICSKNGSWSEQNKTCQCEEGYVSRNGECIDPSTEVAATEPKPGSQCVWPQVFDAGSESCSCAPGYREESGQCIGKSPTQQNNSATVARADGLLTAEIALIQQCLKEAGYLRGAVATQMTKRGWTAFWFFKQDHKVGSTPKGVHDARAQRKLFSLCPLAARAVGMGATTRLAHVDASADGRPAGGDKSPDSAPLAPVRLKKVYTKPEEGCLPADLYRLITSTYGRRPGLKLCQKTCIAIPKGLRGREVTALEKRGVIWCRACLEVSAHLPLDDILNIERGANVQICTRPPTRLPKWKRADRGPRVAYTKVRELYRTLPTATDHAGSIAVIIGNKNYQGGLPANESAHNNASAIYALLTEHLGFSQESIIDIRDATLDEMNRVFDDNDVAPGELQKLLNASPGANVFIYYAGHGTTSLEGTESYLLPVDAVEHREQRTSYPLSRLYDNLARMGARFVMVLLEAGFSRDQSSFVYAPNLPELPSRALPLNPVRNVTVMSAAEKDQQTLDDPAYGIGLFTRYLIEGLAGRADLKPIGNNDGDIDTIELYAYAAHMVGLSARKSYGLLQKPVISHSGNQRISTVQAQVR